MGVGPSAQEQMQNTLFQLKFTAKNLVRESAKCTKREKVQKKKLKKAIEQSNLEGAKIYAANAIREKNQSLQFLTLSSRIEGVAARVQTAVNMNGLTKSMKGVVKGMSRVLDNMNPETISKVLEKFEAQFEDLDVVSSYMGDAMGSSTACATPEDEVDSLMQEVADEHGLDFKKDIAAAPETEVATQNATAAPAGAEADLAARLEALKK